MTETPILDYVKSVALDPAMRADLRLGAAAIAAKYESHSKGPKPYIPKLPAGFKLPRLVSVAACQESLAIITESVLTGVLTPDAGDYLRKHVEAVLPSLQESEVRQEITALKEFIEQVEQKTITLVLMRHLRTLAELRSRYTALRGEELRTHIYITGGVPDQADRVVNIPHFTIHNGLPEVVLPDDGFGIGYVDETCDSEDVLA